ncbi:extracellular solute-binding protein [Paenibacillus sp. J5C_2022]|uniref:extracellular solute-binding protein n=1 Tax=Paenibacillus sp. J5C2022 TaxID=2977129 RepID=UPI0021D07A60|nr:extracellular solute-binding protein [Paenibacillus sp. J5C2022]MCU6713082.1 extracellular solute-binding protein [Paenibacillus sp. J5C2022]
MKRESKFRYSKLANILREQIMSGYIKPGNFLMSENDLCNHYSISRTSVRKSLEQLAQEGLIIKKVGQGTIVNPDLIVENSSDKVLRIFSVSPSHFFDHGLPLIIEEFEQENPNVKIKCLNFSANDFWDSVESSVELGLQPDVILATDRHFRNADTSLEFLDLMPYLPDYSTMIYPRLREAFLRDQKLQGAISTFSSVYLTYNPELFRTHQVPEPTERWSLEEFLEAAHRLTLDTNGDGINDQYGLSLSSSLGRWPVLVLQNGGGFKANCEKAPLVKTLTLIHDLLYRHRVATLSPQYLLNSEAFIKGKAAMMMTTSLEMAGWSDSISGFEPKVASMPFGDHKGTLLTANAFMVPEASNEQEMAIRFVQKALSPSMQEKLGKEANLMSPLRQVNEKNWSTSLFQSLHINEDITMNSYFIDELFGDTSDIEEIVKEMHLFWAGIESAEEFAEKMIAIMNS